MLFRRTSEETADREINFRLLRPTLRDAVYDPDAVGLRIEAGPGDTRRELSSGWSALHSWSVRYELSTDFARLRVKQFLYDWGPCSSLDHAALCDNRLDCLRIQPLDRVRVAWTGIDYAGCRALSMLAWGTNVELRELAKSSRQDTEIYMLNLARSFRPVSNRELPPMAERSYWSRWQRYDRSMTSRPGYRLPSSLWLWRWPWLPAEHRWTSSMTELDLQGIRERHSDVFSPDWTFDSACIFRDRTEAAEVQLLFRPASGSGHACLWLRRFSKRPGSIGEPAVGEWPLLDPSGDPHAIRRARFTDSKGWNAFAASRTTAHGPHDIVWWGSRHGFLLQISAAVGHDLRYAADLISKAMNDEVSIRDEI